MPLDHVHKTRNVTFLAVAELLGMTAWFSASAVVPALSAVWHLGDAGRAWLTMAVQIGFVVGALLSAFGNLADRWPSHRLFGGSALLAAAATAAIPLFDVAFATAVVLRFLVGLALAGVYPVGMKIVATWTQRDRGWGIGLLVGALTVGSATPHLLSGWGGMWTWKEVLGGAALLTAAGGLLAATSVREGPFRAGIPGFDWRYVGRSIRQVDLNLANLGYLGHMWELYAMWTWVPAFLHASFAASPVAGFEPSLAAFVVIAAGAVGSLLAGRMADRFGRTTAAIGSMVVSGACSLTIGLTFGMHPAVSLSVALVWGFTVVADSAQFSACVSELAEPEYVGTALTLQTSMGFLLTLATIRLIPTAVGAVGWDGAFAVLALGPAIGVLGMAALRRRPESLRLAGGRR